MEFEKMIEEILSNIDTYKVAGAVILALIGFLLSLRVIKIYIFFFAVAAGILGLVWHLDWVTFQSLKDLLLATVLIYGLNAFGFMLARGAFFAGLTLNVLAFLSALWLLPGMTATSPLLAALVYVALANGFGFLAGAVIAASEPFGEGDQYDDGRY